MRNLPSGEVMEDKFAIKWTKGRTGRTFGNWASPGACHM